MSAGTANPTDPAEASDLVRARALLSATAIRALAEDRWTRWRPWLDAPVFALLVVGLTLIFTPAGQSVRPIPPLDTIASETVRAERAVSVEDKAATDARRAAAAEASLPVFDYDPELYLTLAKRVTEAFEQMAARAREMTLAPAQRRAAFQEALGRPVPQVTFDALERLDSPADAAAAIGYLLNLGLDRMVAGDRGDLPAEGPINVQDLQRDRLEKALVAGVMDVAQIRRLIQARAGDAPYGSARGVRGFIVDTAIALAAPNLLSNPQKTQTLRAKAAVAVEPVMVRIAVGEVVIREGDRVTKTAQDRLRLLNEGGAQRSALSETLAVGALILGLTLLGGSFFRASRTPSHLGRKQIYMTLSVLAGTALIGIACWYAGRGVAVGLGFPADAATFLPPVAIATVVVALVVDTRTSLLVGIGLALLMAYRVGGDIWVLAHYLVAVLAAGMTARRGRRRSDILKIGLTVAAAQLVLVPIMVVLDTTVPPAELSYFAASAVAGVVGALLTAAFTTAGLPLLEWIFDETTDMRLLELASADNPLLKQLALRSPGTYYHSVMMANLAETAAEAIGGNGLQCRVMALYHDLGKMERPSYFAENQRGGNIHDRLPPELSARIIFAHIKDGIDIARKHHLGRPVLDAITQHQGTTLLRVFYQRAVERAQATGETVNEAEFRYPGPRPATRESGILMLADTVEAATRALKEPKPADVRERVAKVISEKIADHQLDDCALTMKDLAKVEAAFVRVLTLGVYHTRIEYPPLMPPVPKKEPTPDRRHDDANAATGDTAANRPPGPTTIGPGQSSQGQPPQGQSPSRGSGLGTRAS
ncbi:HDIG domain-containing protein [Oleomonas cavernae]|uniref:HDIG domain-containing protein n=1 Tax=Oleomonas cavernae TaxID=2320859 RepID=A0A418WHP8_9PROT|nr:HDIG domain-containing metalloprotein [Oleomonas cavernae]RJF89553.1 HDIG domain-containing protein [Oleomonas cavernae]